MKSDEKEYISSTSTIPVLYLINKGVKEITKIFECCQSDILSQEMFNFIEPYQRHELKIKPLDVFDRPEFYFELFKDITVLQFAHPNSIKWTFKSKSHPMIYDIPEVKFHFCLLTTLFNKGNTKEVFNFIKAVYKITLPYFEEPNVFDILILADFEKLVKQDRKKSWAQNIISLEQLKDKYHDDILMSQRFSLDLSIINSKLKAIESEDFIKLLNYLILDYDDIPDLKLLYENKMIYSRLINSIKLFNYQENSNNDNEKEKKFNMHLLLNDIIKEDSEDDLINTFRDILYSQSTFDLFIEILKSDAVKCYYNNTIEYDKEQHDYKQNMKLKNYYDQYLYYERKENKEYEFDSETMKKFIFLLRMKKKKKGLTVNYLRIGVNYRHILFKKGNMKTNEEMYKKMILVYLLLSLLYESCHFIRKVLNIDQSVDEITNQKSLNNGQRPKGKKIIQHLFKKEVIRKMDLSQAIDLLNIQNWSSNKTLISIMHRKTDTGNFHIIFMAKPRAWDPCVI